MSSTITSVIVSGAAGRMGARVCALAAQDARFALVGALERASCAALGAPAALAQSKESTVPITAACAARADVIIDFSSDEGARAALRTAQQGGAALLVGTTALSTETISLLKSAAAQIAVLVAPNTSLGVGVLARAAAEVARALGPGFDISLVEAHHAQKKDAPSGTALRLARAIAEAGGTLRAEQIVALRGGDVVGEHTLRFAGAGEYLELTHRATSRDVFVHGALRAAAWLRGRPPGWYSMEDVLGLPRG